MKLDDIKYGAMVINQGVYPQVSLSKVEFDWLIKQAEKAERLDKVMKENLTSATYHVIQQLTLESEETT
jgi:hypothetical protein